MGNDGGSIPTRRELVKEPGKKLTHSQIRDTEVQTQEYRWTTCPLSKRPLASPVMSDCLGRLYNKDAIIEWLLHGTDAFGDGEEVLEGRVKSLKDLLEVKFEVLESQSPKEAARGEKWVCPVTQKELGPGTKSVYLVPCGHAFSENAVKEVGSSESGCLTCSTPYEQTNVIFINTIDAKEIDRLTQRSKDLSEAGLTHTLKKANGKSKKRKKENDERKEARDRKAESGIRNSAAANLTSKVLEDEKLQNKKRKMEMSENVKSLFSNDSGKDLKGNRNDFMTRGYSLTTDSKAK